MLEAANGPHIQAMETPIPLAAELAIRFGRGGFDLDVAASAFNALADRYYDEEIDGLAQPWNAESVWCNPPYGNILPWVIRAIEEVENDNAGVVVMCLPARTSTPWFQIGLAHGEAYFIEGRVSFIDPQTGQPKKGNFEHTVILVFQKGLRAKDHR